MEISPNNDINILIVDDNEGTLMTLESALEQSGVNIFVAESGTLAWQICLSQNIDIALIDINMPVLDGFELLKLIKEYPKTTNIMVLLMTGYSMNSENVVKGLSKGAVDFLFKPLDAYITIAKVSSLISMVRSRHEIEEKNRELERYQGELIALVSEAQKSKSFKENFLANMSHEIRSPLNAISGLTRVLKMSELNKNQLEVVELMEYSSKSLLGIVNDVLDISKIEAGKITIINDETNLGKLTEKYCALLKPMADEKNIDLLYSIDKDLPEVVMADELRLGQILMNLLSNAIKFTEKGYVAVSVNAGQQIAGQIDIEIVVKDTGIGIAQESVNKIFTRFEQAEDNTAHQFGGTGLGLAIVKKLVELQGGNLKLESTPGKGTTFTLKNKYQLTEKLYKTGEPYELYKFDKFNVLLVEDNIINQCITEGILAKWNVNVDIANHGQEAIEMIREKTYDMVLMDAQMPVMNGNEATRKIKTEMEKEKQDIPILSFSASVSENEKIDAISAGVNDFIDKPFELEHLHRKIARLIAKRKKSVSVTS